MKNRIKTILIAALLLSFAATVPASACTIFMQEDGKTVLAGNNEDWMYSSGTYMLITAPDKESYGRVTFYISSYVQGGMNEKGLFYDSAVCPSSKLPYDKNKETLDKNYGEMILSKCKTVDEVIDIFKEYNYPWPNDHVLVTDANGDSAVLEWVKGKLKIIRKEKNNYQLITNFWISYPTLGGYPCKRFTTAEEMLNEGAPSVEHFADILNFTKQDWGDGGTLYSNVYDLTNQSVYIFNSGKLDAACKVDLKTAFENLAAGETERTAIKDMNFNHTVSLTTSIVQLDDMKENTIENNDTHITKTVLPIMGVPDYSIVYGIGALITGTIAFRRNKK